jgi:hypothetical protein
LRGAQGAAAGKSPSAATRERAGVRASIRAKKGRNGSGAKGRRKVDEERRRTGGTPAAQCLRAKPDEGSTRHRWSRAPGRCPFIIGMTLGGGRGSSPILRPFSWASVELSSLLSEVKPPTGEPDAGNPPVRFGGRGIRIQSFLPTPIASNRPPARSFLHSNRRRM